MAALDLLLWAELTPDQRDAAIARAPVVNDAETETSVRRIIGQIRADGDNSLRALTRRFDGATIDALAVPTAGAVISSELHAAMDLAISNLTTFHKATRPQDFTLSTQDGVRCGVVVRPVQSVGLYIPGGSAPLVSTALMLGVPAVLAGCPNIIAFSPPSPDGKVNAGVLAALEKVGIETVYRAGGAQAIAAMAFGTQSVPRVDKIFGPGNRFVTAAKQIVTQLPGGPAIDMPAGPSEVLVIADRNANPTYVAADLLSQAEHGPDSQAILVTDSSDFARTCREETLRQVQSLPRAAIAQQALEHSRILVADDMEVCVEIANRYASEHLIINTVNAPDLVEAVYAAGSIFVGPWSAEALGDYCSGTNHVLPTYGAARSASGVSMESFFNRLSVQQVSRTGLDRIGPAAQCMAAAEGLEAHRRAVALRMECEG